MSAVRYQRLIYRSLCKHVPVQLCDRMLSCARAVLLNLTVLNLQLDQLVL